MATLSEADFDRFVEEATEEAHGESFAGAERNMRIVFKINRHFGKPEVKDVEDENV